MAPGSAKAQTLETHNGNSFEPVWLHTKRPRCSCTSLQQLKCIVR